MSSNSKFVTGIKMLSYPSVIVIGFTRSRIWYWTGVSVCDTYGPPPVPLKFLFTIAFALLTLIRESCQVLT